MDVGNQIYQTQMLLAATVYDGCLKAAREDYNKEVEQADMRFHECRDACGGDSDDGG